MEADEFKKAVGKNIKQLRGDLNLSQKKLAFMLGYTNSNSLSDIEKGNNSFSVSKLPLFLKKLKCTPEQLLSPIFKEKDKEFIAICSKLKILSQKNGYRNAIFSMIESLYKEVTLEKDKKIHFEPGEEGGDIREEKNA